jgi:hypothetical protein
MLENKSTPLWWRIDTRTGQTLGMGPNGGEAITEYAVELKMASATVTALGIMYASFSCGTAYPNNPKMQACCLAGNALVGVGAGKFVAKGAANWADLGATGLVYFIGALSGEIAYGGILSAAIPLPDYVCSAVLE